MPSLPELGSILIGTRVVSKGQWEKASAAGETADSEINGLLAVLKVLATEPPHWWDRKPPAPPGLTEYQQAVIRSRFVGDELSFLRRDLALNQFLLLSKLGQGGQGEVYRARQLNPPRYAAVKTLVRDTEARRRRFEQEAKAMMKIQHSAVARFYLYERVRDSLGEPTDEYLIAMEFVSGIVTHRLVHRIGPIPWKFAAHWTISLLSGLDVIHQNGFVHGDVKPENVMTMGPIPGPNVRFESTSAKLLDFGAAKRLGGGENDEGAPKRTFVGTPEYAPPEQWTGSLVAASDLYALGGTLFYMLTGRFPYQKDRRDPQAYRESHTNDPLLEVREFAPETPVEVGRVIQTLMAKSPDDRGTAEESIAALKAALARDSAVTTASASKPKPKSTLLSPPPGTLSKPINKAEDDRSPIYRIINSVLATLERSFIPGYFQPLPGEEASVPERVIALLRRPMVLGLSLILLILVVYGLYKLMK